MYSLILSKKCAYWKKWKLTKKNLSRKWKLSVFLFRHRASVTTILLNLWWVSQITCIWKFRRKDNWWQLIAPEKILYKFLRFTSWNFVIINITYQHIFSTLIGSWIIHRGVDLKDECLLGLYPRPSAAMTLLHSHCMVVVFVNFVLFIKLFWLFF